MSLVESTKDPIILALEAVHATGSNPSAALPILEPLLHTFTDSMDITDARLMIGEGYIYLALEDEHDIDLFEKGINMLISEAHKSKHPRRTRKVLNAYERAGRTEDIAKWKALIEVYDKEWRDRPPKRQVSL